MAMGQRTVSVIPANPIMILRKSKDKKTESGCLLPVSTELGTAVQLPGAGGLLHDGDYENPGWKFQASMPMRDIRHHHKKQDRFNKLIEDCMAGKIDLVLTKSISRFARNTLDCIQYIRKTERKNIGVFLKKKRQHPDSTGEFHHHPRKLGPGRKPFQAPTQGGCPPV